MKMKLAAALAGFAMFAGLGQAQRKANSISTIGATTPAPN